MSGELGLEWLPGNERAASLPVDPLRMRGTGDKAPGPARSPTSKVGAAIIMPLGPISSLTGAEARTGPCILTSGLMVKSVVGSRMMSPVASREKGDTTGAVRDVAMGCLNRGAERVAGTGADAGRERGPGGGSLAACRMGVGVASG